MHGQSSSVRVAKVLKNELHKASALYEHIPEKKNLKI